MRFIRNVLSNLATLLLAFVLALIIWVNAVQVEDPIRSAFLQIPIEFVGQPENSKLMTPTSQSVQIVFEGPDSVVSQLTPQNFSAVVDLSQVPFGEPAPVNVQVRSMVPRVIVLSQSIETLIVHLEQLVSRNIPVTLDIRGSVARGHTQGEPVIDPPFITVVGTSSQVEPLDVARATIFLNNERETRVYTSQPIFYDKQGRVASVSGLSLSTEQVTVTIPVSETAGFAEKLISVDWIGEPAPGYRLLSVEVNPPSVLVQGRQAQLNQLNRVQTETIDITGLQSSFRQQVALVLPDGITLDEVEEVFVDIEIEPLLTTAIYNRVPQLQGLGRNLEARVVPESVRVVLFGPLPDLNALPEEEVRVTLDLFGLDTGTYSLQPDVDFPGQGIELRSIQPAQVMVHITRTPTVTNQLTTTLHLQDLAPVVSAEPLPATDYHSAPAAFPIALRPSLAAVLWFPWAKRS